MQGALLRLVGVPAVNGNCDTAQNVRRGRDGERCRAWKAEAVDHDGEEIGDGRRDVVHLGISKAHASSSRTHLQDQTQEPRLGVGDCQPERPTDRDFIGSVLGRAIDLEAVLQVRFFLVGQPADAGGRVGHPDHKKEPEADGHYPFDNEQPSPACSRQLMAFRRCGGQLGYIPCKPCAPSRVKMAIANNPPIIS